MREVSQLTDMSTKTASKAWGPGVQKNQAHQWNREVTFLARKTADYLFGNYLP